MTGASSDGWQAGSVLETSLSIVRWEWDQWLWLAVAGLLVCGAVAFVKRRLADRAAPRRVAVELVPSRRFEPSAEEIFRYGALLTRAAAAEPWWMPRQAKAVRVRLRADGTRPLSYRVEGPGAAVHLLRTSPYGQVRCERTAPVVRDKQRKYVVRAQFELRGGAGDRLRDVPLEPDPLQPLVDAVADLRVELGDLAEVCLDFQRAPGWRLKARRWQVLQAARQRERREAHRAARWVQQDYRDVEDSIGYHLSRLLTPGEAERRQHPHRRLMVPPAPRRVEREKALGKLADDAHLVCVQLMVRCASDTAGRAERRLRHIETALDVFAARTRFAWMGRVWGPIRWGPDRRPWRSVFDHRWRTGQMRPPRANWVHLEELAGLLKPPTVHCRLPVLASDVPTFRVGDPAVLLQGWHRGADGRWRLLATREEETLYELAVGKSGGGKTERALCQAVGAAHAGHGLAYVDPHGDSWRRAAPYLAHDAIMERIARIDLAVTGPRSLVGTWNPLGVDRGQPAHEVVGAVVDALAAALGWSDMTAPRAITIATKAVEALVAVNIAACRAQRPDCQATIFHVRPLLSDQAFREAVVARLDSEQAAWWQTSFAAIPADALPTVLNPLDRLAATPAVRAMLGSPVGAYDIRTAMDQRMVVWICPAGNGPTDRLVVALLVRDLLRAGLSRRELDERVRVPFRAYLDELISLDGAAGSSIAEILEQLRKFRVRVHGMTQLLQRLSPEVRASLMQNSSTLATTAGAVDAIRHVTNEWGDQVDPAEVTELDLYHHYISLTVDGRRVGPLQLRGPDLTETFRELARPRAVGALTRAADAQAQAKPLHQLTDIADKQRDKVLGFLTSTAPHVTARATTTTSSGPGEAASRPRRNR
ncbi:ATP/GTP-binding protein [Streptomyces sp. NA02950]|uniref:ATP/GTP-binding protein n=1 Tax=Streptomyces sp. NA02950 TaxID=2742137 RepID=UPI001591F56E|nr:ATP/GTP-binding protein [Streptomyces sp. NA02950]QKV90398.1 ATP/GTP-binding protein [Streptomyces sp. NA02950]QKV97269.1 ATP/GTP-binding protein [Streptomyces sp. NA02950]